jgi:drug/metabolite transporter (DMT)-like permease
MNNLWIFLSFLAMIISAVGVICLKLIDKSKYDNYIFLAITFFLTGIISLIYILMTKKNRKLFISNCDNKLFIYTILFAILLIFNNYIMQQAFKYSPNIGYSHLIINLNIIITLIAGYFLFNQKINPYTFFGIILTLTGITVIIFNQNA